MGKSTAINWARDWFEREAPFISFTVRQWRPSLLPSLASWIGKKESQDPEQAPRRKPGRFHLFRLVYYYFDFLIGSFCKDRKCIKQARLVVYDRCAIDMLVDPLRYGLKSSWGTRLLSRLSPKPHFIIFLSDDANRIYNRKRHLEEVEIREQLNIWRELMNQDQVHAVVTVNGPEVEIATRILDLLLSGFIQANEHHINDAADGLECLRWIRTILTGRVNMPRDGDNGSNGRARSSPNHHRHKFFAVPGTSRPRFLIPEANRNIMSESLGIYNAQTRVARFSRSLLGVSLRAGIAQPFLRRLASVPVDLTASCPTDGETESLFSYLDAIFGEERMSYAVSLGTPGPHRKPVLLIVNGRGETAGYAKLGWNDESIRLVRNETAALRRLENTPFGNVAVPRVLHSVQWRELHLLVQSSVASSGNSPQAFDARHVEFLLKLHRFLSYNGELPLPDMRTIAALQQRGFHYYAHLIHCARTFCKDRIGDARVPLVPLHGDFTPWNIRSFPGGLLICDWEHAQFCGPAGWDIFHFLISTAVLVHRQNPGQVYRAIKNPGPISDFVQHYLNTVGISREAVAPLMVSYLAKTLSDDLFLLGVRIAADDEATRTTWAALLNIVMHDNEARPRVAA
ncbi:MAG TPA: phosphotransferase [Terriglobales bacterium]|nr:phosphotransferase [Terriglobales bacterium]